MKASEAKPVFRSFPYHSTAHTHIPTCRETQQRSPRQCLLCLPRTQGCTDCASAFSMALQLLTGQSPGDFLTAHSFQSRFTQLQNNLSPYCCIQRGVVKPPSWTVTGRSCRSQPCLFSSAPPPSNTKIWLPQLCPWLCHHLAPTFSYTWRGCAEESLPALKGLLSFALAVQYSLTSLSSLRELITPQIPEDLLRI